MKKVLVAISAASVLIISSFESRGSLAAAPQASPSQPAKAQDAQDQPSIVGTWLASYDGGFRKALLQWHKDGTGSQLLNFAAKTGNALMGDWKMVDDQTVSAFLIGWSYDDNGDTLTGYFTKVETLVLTHDGYSGHFHVTFYDLQGNVIFDHEGTLTATRVSAGQ